VDVMVAIRSNFFYTRTVPCELWFLNRDKPEAHRDKVLMLDALTVYRMVTRKIYDFSHEQEQNLLTIVWLYRGETERFLGLVSQYLGQVVDEGQACIERESEEGEAIRLLQEVIEAVIGLHAQVHPFVETQSKTGPHAETLAEFEKEQKLFAEDVQRFQADIGQAAAQWENTQDTNAGLNRLVKEFAPLAESSRDLVKETDLLYNLASRLIEICENECDAKAGGVWVAKDVTRARKIADEARRAAVEQLKLVHYFWRQAHWLTERFPEAELCDVEGLVKLVDRVEIEANDWSLTPGRYVGVPLAEKDEDFDFEEALLEIHVELEDLNSEAVDLAAKIKKNFGELGV